MLSDIFKLKRDRCSKVAQSHNPIKLDNEFQSCLDKWRQDPSSFFVLESVDGIPENDYAVSLVSYLQALNDRSRLSECQRRVILVALYRLNQALQGINKALATYVGQQMAVTEQISGIPDPQQVNDYVIKGKRYSGIVEDLTRDTGVSTSTDILLVLPSEVPSTMLVSLENVLFYQLTYSRWEKELRVKGPDRSRIIDSLKERGILDAAKQCHGITDIIFQFLHERLTQWMFINFEASSHEVTGGSNDHHPTKHSARKRPRTSEETQWHNSTPDTLRIDQGHAGIRPNYRKEPYISGSALHAAVHDVSGLHLSPQGARVSASPERGHNATSMFRTTTGSDEQRTAMDMFLDTSHTHDNGSNVPSIRIPESRSCTPLTTTLPIIAPKGDSRDPIDILIKAAQTTATSSFSSDLPPQQCETAVSASIEEHHNEEWLSWIVLDNPDGNFDNVISEIDGRTA